MLLTNAAIATMIPGATMTPGTAMASGDRADASYGLIRQGAIVVADGRIIWAGAQDALPRDLAAQHESTDLEGRLITPGLIDCHTHIVFGGDRAREFEMRLEGASYAEIARAGGGIVSTVRATRAASQDALVAQALPRVDSLLAEGVTTIEIKSGYGLDLETEQRMLRAARQIAQERPLQIVTSFLGAHAIPPDYADRPDDYIDDVCLPTLERLHGDGLIDAVDGFCEGIGFSVPQITRVFDKAAALGLPVKLHAEQLSNIGGTRLAAQYQALSADHLEFATEADVQAMAAADTVAVLLPGAFYILRETQLPPIDALRTHKVPMALATDCNPGSSPVTSLLTIMNMACTLFRMTPAEALAGTTRHAAKALGLNDRGTIAAGMRADLAIWDVDDPAALAYYVGHNPLYRRLFGDMP